MCEGNNTVLTDELRIVHGICSLALALVGTLGNVMSMALICKAQLYRKAPLMMLIIDLCVANSMSTVVILPLISITSFYRQWLYGDFICKAFAYVMYVSLTSECFILTNLTVCQYLVVVHRVPIKTTLLNREKYIRLFALLGLPWVIPSCMYLVPLSNTWDTFGYDPRRGYCTLLNKQQGFGFQAACSMALMAIMTIVTFYCYSAIFYIQFRSSRKTTSRAHRARRKFRGCARKVHVMIMAILLNYIFTYLPFLVTCVVDPCLTMTPLWMYTAVIYVSWSHTAINSVIYALMNTKVNIMWRRLINCICLSSLLQESPTDSLRRQSERNTEIEVSA